jgi:GNAT superfamily N-acetyltransferase
MLFSTSIDEFKIRYATEKDCALILQMINELIEYENMTDESFATEESIYESIFIRKKAKVIIGEWLGEAVASAIFFNQFSTFKGTEGVYLEDIYIREKYRGKGFGKIMMAFVANYAKENKCPYMEWMCLDWNTPSIKFYEKIGARSMKEWIKFELSGEYLEDMANSLKKN